MRTQTLVKRAGCTFGLAVVLAAAVGCGGGDDNPYKPQPAWSGKAASIPAPPTLPSTPIKNGNDYTVYGAVHQLRSMMHAKDVTAPPAISIVGYIVDSNIPRAPDCAVHKTGKADPEGCNTEVPSFWVADDKGDMKGLKVRVVGWARNYAVIYDAMKAYAKLKPGDTPTDKQLVTDDMLNVTEPFPLPAVGAKVRITGAYNVAKTVVSDMVSEPIGGVMALQKLDTLEPAPEPAKFAKPIQ
jgi:hypothetical protein